MALIEAGGVRHYYRMDGREDRPVVIFVHSLGCDHSQWDPQVADLQDHFRILRYDVRGHGASGVSPGDYSIELLARDSLALADALGIAQFAFCGLSLGGMIGQWLAAKAPERVTHVVLANTSARLPDPSVMDTRRKTVLASGMSTVVDAVMQRFFTAENLAAGRPGPANIRRVFLATNPVGYAGCCAAVRDMNLAELHASIRTPAVIIVGDRDLSTPWEGNGEVVARGIPHARVERLPTAHLSNIERPHSFSTAVMRLIAPCQGSGEEKRRSVLGDAHVDRAAATANDFTRDFQELITQYAWGAVWQRPGLNDRTRRMLTLAITASLGRWEEFRMHVRTGLERELEPCDLKEALLQTAVYAGVAAANHGFQVAAEEMKNA